MGKAGAPKYRFQAYFKGARTACAYRIEECVKYSQPISLSALREIEETFRPPQNFSYCARFEALATHLVTVAAHESLGVHSDGLHFVPISDNDYPRFRGAVEEHISGSYLETGAEYADKLLELHRAGIDHEGVFTRRKWVMSAVRGQDEVGYVVLTEKLGGSVKTGPTILFDEHQRQGLGVRIRAELRDRLRKAGYRKVYCTAPSDKPAATRYLIASGARIEAHLERHYHEGHDELVFGEVLDIRRSTAAVSASDDSKAEVVRRVDRYDPMLEEFIAKTMPRQYMRVPTAWPSKQIRAAARLAKGGRPGFKARLMYYTTGERINGLVICVFKRGGSAKLLTLVSSTDESVPRELIRRARRKLTTAANKCRKLYAHVPLSEPSLLNAFLAEGFSIEGLLTMPYCNSRDLVVLGQMLDDDDANGVAK